MQHFQTNQLLETSSIWVSFITFCLVHLGEYLKTQSNRWLMSNRNLFLPVYEDGECKIKVIAGSVLVRVHFLDLSGSHSLCSGWKGSLSLLEPL